MIWRGGFYLALLACAALVIGVQLDRQTYEDAALARLVPQPFRAVARQRLVEASVSAADPAGTAMLANARRLVRLRPLPARHLLLYAQAAQASGAGNEVVPALELAALRGWREPVPQLVSAQASLLTGDYPAAAQRIAALLATGAAPHETDQLLSRSVQDAGGREAMVQMLATRGYWSNALPRRLAAAAGAQDFAELVTQARARGLLFECTLLRETASRHARNGAGAQAERIMAGDCAG